MSKLVEKLLLYKVRLIIANELQSPYYKNAANVQEVIDLEMRNLVNMTNKYQTTYHIKNVMIYKNDFIKFNDFINTIHHFPEIPVERLQKQKKIISN